MLCVGAWCVLLRDRGRAPCQCVSFRGQGMEPCCDVAVAEAVEGSGGFMHGCECEPMAGAQPPATPVVCPSKSYVWGGDQVHVHMPVCGSRNLRQMPQRGSQPNVLP